MRRVSAFALVLLLAAGCSEPPQKEIDQAQGALDTARAAGADKYAPEEYSAAASSLQKAHDAVDQRDYRQALSYAIDARERAHDAARASVDGKAQARGAAEKAFSEVSHAADDLEARLRSADAARVPAKDLRGWRQTLANGRTSLQHARSQIDAGDYQDATKTLKDDGAQFSSAMTELDTLMQRAAKRRK